MDDYKNDMKKIQAALDPIKREKENYDAMVKSLTKDATASVKAMSSIINSNTIEFTNHEINAARSMSKALTAFIEDYQSAISDAFINIMQQNIEASLRKYGEVIKLVNDYYDENLKNIGKLMEETFSLKPMIEEFARISTLSLNSDNSKSINFEEFNSNTAIDYINNDDELNKQVSAPIIEMANNNKEILDIAIEAYKKGLVDGQDLKQSPKTVGIIDIINIILTFISIIASIYCTLYSPPTIEINNNYYNTEETESKKAQFEKVLPEIEQSKQE